MKYYYIISLYVCTYVYMRLGFSTCLTCSSFLYFKIAMHILKEENSGVALWIDLDEDSKKIVPSSPPYHVVAKRVDSTTYTVQRLEAERDRAISESEVMQEVVAPEPKKKYFGDGRCNNVVKEDHRSNHNSSSSNSSGKKAAICKIDGAAPRQINFERSFSSSSFVSKGPLMTMMKRMMCTTGE